ncbi:hypothetical protein NEMBOFW57_001043 [Staphylotrichum longicolle]|uniref:Carbohydrate-binding module family 50 protein n=1 Tax=Staphylotrichum longicolle TaxID=669026 RepID=A0AAD4HXJ9_9PEZI|nr:hypothetical protein NEMBOFW57_001043 [Staphylotrichum longicolle]
MGRWSHLDSDEDRLPSGMTRIGYDADTQIYTYRDSDGSYWEGAPGCQYGKLHRVRPAPRLPSVVIPEIDDGDEAPYILHDNDDDSDSDFHHSADDDAHSLNPETEKEKEPENKIAAPNKAVLHTTTTTAPHPAITLKTLPAREDDDGDKLSLSGTTVVSVPYSDLPTSPQPATALKRSGTLSRLARFLSSSSSSSASGTGTKTGSGRPLSRRRATVAGEGARQQQQQQGRRGKMGRTATVAAAGGWSGPEEGDDV